MPEDEDDLINHSFGGERVSSSDFLGLAICLLKLKQMPTLEADEDVNNLKTIAEEDGVDPRLGRIVDCIPVELAIWKGKGTRLLRVKRALITPRRHFELL